MEAMGGTDVTSSSTSFSLTGSPAVDQLSRYETATCCPRIKCHFHAILRLTRSLASGLTTGRVSYQPLLPDCNHCLLFCVMEWRD